MEDLILKIRNTVIEGEEEEVVELVKEAVEKGLPIVPIVEEGLIGAMNIVGPKMASGELFVPEVLMSAEAMHAGLDILKPHMQAGDMKSLGTVVLGTVEGDLHDIGKNLVGMMLESSGFTVVDLGVDQSPENFIKAVEEHRPEIVGLSALLTTTMQAMRETVRLLKEQGIPLKVMVGGAPVSQEFAEEIGADGFSYDGAGAVELAKILIDQEATTC